MEHDEALQFAEKFLGFLHKLEEQLKVKEDLFPLIGFVERSEPGFPLDQTHMVACMAENIRDFDDSYMAIQGNECFILVYKPGFSVDDLNSHALSAAAHYTARQTIERMRSARSRYIVDSDYPFRTIPPKELARFLMKDRLYFSKSDVLEAAKKYSAHPLELFITFAETAMRRLIYEDNASDGLVIDANLAFLAQEKVREPSTLSKKVYDLVSILGTAAPQLYGADDLGQIRDMDLKDFHFYINKLYDDLVGARKVLE